MNETKSCEKNRTRRKKGPEPSPSGQEKVGQWGGGKKDLFKHAAKK